MKTTKKSRIILFLTICFTLRLAIAYIAKIAPQKYLPYIGYLSLIPAIGFAYNYINTKKIGGFRQKAWWNYMRPIHSILYFTFAILAIQKNKNAYIITLLDTVIGLLAFINHHFL